RAATSRNGICSEAHCLAAVLNCPTIGTCRRVGSVSLDDVRNPPPMSGRLGAVSDRSPEAIFQSCDTVTWWTNGSDWSRRIRPLAEAQDQRFENCSCSLRG